MIRAQYHFRESERGLLAWNVRRLIERGRSLPVGTVKVCDIAELDENRGYAHGAVVLTCRSIVEHCRLIARCDLSFPITLDTNGRVMDGMHRVCRALLDGVEELPAVRFDVDPEPDHVGIAPGDLPYDS